MDPFSLLESWLIREAGFWILTRRKERDFGGGGGFHDNWELGSQEILSLLRTFTNEAERTLDLPRRRSRQGTSPWLSM